MKDKLSKEAKEYLEAECSSSIKFYAKELQNTVKNKFVPLDAKITIKAYEQKRLNMFKEILEFIK